MSTPSHTVAQLERCFQDVASRFQASEPMRLLSTGGFGPAHYGEYLRQVFHHTRENPALMALAASRLRGASHEVVRWWLDHAGEELGHEQWALSDLALLGEDVSNVPTEMPLPTTLALMAFAEQQIWQQGPLAHLGYLWFLEFLPTTSGAGYMDLLAQQGVPREALSFLRRHALVDQKHTRQLCRYADALIHDEADMRLACLGMQATGRLYEDFLRGVIEQVRDPQPRHVNPVARQRR